MVRTQQYLNCFYSFPFSEDVNQLSGKIDNISLSGALALSLDMEQQHKLFGQQQVSFVETLQVWSSFDLPLLSGWGGEESVIKTRSEDSSPWIRLSCSPSYSGITVFAFDTHEIMFFSCFASGTLQWDSRSFWPAEHPWYEHQPDRKWRIPVAKLCQSQLPWLRLIFNWYLICDPIICFSQFRRRQIKFPVQYKIYVWLSKIMQVWHNWIFILILF